MNKILREYRGVLKFLSISKIYIWIISFLFIISAVIGFFFPVFFVDYIQKYVEQVVSQTLGMNYPQLFLFIAQNNIVTSFIGMTFGLFFGIIPLFFSFFNGYVIGFVMNKAVGIAGIGILWRLFPHGIFEIPALILSLALGLRLGMFVFRKKTRKDTFLLELTNIVKVFLLVILPLLIVAGIIEAGLMILSG